MAILGTIHKRRQHFFSIFYTLFYMSAVFYVYLTVNFTEIWQPSKLLTSFYSQYLTLLRVIIFWKVIFIWHSTNSTWQHCCVHGIICNFFQHRKQGQLNFRIYKFKPWIPPKERPLCFWKNLFFLTSFSILTNVSNNTTITYSSLASNRKKRCY